MTGLIIFGSLLIGMFMGLPVCFALLAACLIYLIPSGIPLTIVPQTMIAGMNSFVLLAIPLFTMTGYLMEQTSLSRRLVDFVEALFCRSRGSMGVVTIVTCAIFAALTGSGPATVAAIGAIMMPALTRANYPKSTSAGMIAAGGALGPIIPPSANMVVYGAAMGLSVSKMFIGGVLPGIMMAVALCLVNVYLAAKYKFAKSDVRYPKKEVLRRTARAIRLSPSTSTSECTRRRQMSESLRVKTTWSGSRGCCPAKPSPGSELSSMVVPSSISRPSSESGSST